MKVSFLAASVGAAMLLAGCQHVATQTQGDTQIPSAAVRALETVRENVAPDPHMSIFQVGLEPSHGSLALTGEVERVEFKQQAIQALERAGIKAQDRVEVLPERELGDQIYGIVCLSVANGREQPDHKAEMGTQILMGEVVKIWKSSRHWFYVQSRDGYLSWVESGAIYRCTREQVDAWERAEQAMVTAFDEQVLEAPTPEARPVSDVVMGDRLKLLGGLNGLWLKVELPDGRDGWLWERAATNYAGWKKSRQATSENIEKTAFMFLGRPYLWGGTSPKGLDCSGFAKFVFFLNGVELHRNASEQARQGTEIPLGDSFSKLRKGDLLFFGWAGRRGRPEWVTHVGIYLGDQQFIQSAQRVKISSLDPASPIYDAGHARGLIAARRILPVTQ